MAEKFGVALVISLLIFAFFWVVGFAVLGLLYRRDDSVRTALIAPALGALVTIYPCYVLSRLGLAIGTVGLPLSVVLLLAAVAAIALRRPALPVRAIWPYGVIVLASFVASGWPLLTMDFAWLGNLNPDASHYFLRADRLLHEGYLAFPDARTWTTESSWSDFEVHFVLGGERQGSDFLLATLESVTGLDGPAAYMPLILALHVAALAAATALVGTPHRFARLLSGVLLAVCALSTAGVTLELIAQELGLACLALGGVLMLSPFYRLAPSALARYGALAALVLADFFISYPEMLPFLVLAFPVYHLARWRELLRYWRRALVAGAVIGVTALLLVAPDLLNYVNFMLQQADSATSAGRKLAESFPYILIPSGVGVLWGLRTFYPGGPAAIGEQSAIAIGLGLTAAAVAGALWQLLRQEAVAAIVIVMAALGADLFIGNTGFGSFKLAMYAQPFVMPVVVLSTCRLLRVAR